MTESTAPLPPPTAGPDAATLARRPSLAGLTEITLPLLTTVLAVGMGRLFTSWSFLIPVLLPALAVHLSGTLVRRLGPGMTTVALAQSTAGVLVWAALCHRRTLFYGLPAGDTWTEAFAQASAALRPFRTLIAPVPPAPGLVTVTSLMLVAIALYSDLAAHVGRVPVQATTTHIGAYIFITLLARGPRQVLAGTLFTGGMLLHLVATRAEGAGRAAWRKGDRAPGSRRVLWTGLAAALLVTSVGGITHLAVTSRFDPRWDVRSLGRQSSPRHVVSPLVSVGDRLRTQSDAVMFTATGAAVPGYWRLTALDLFDGATWSSRGSFRPESGNNLGPEGGSEGSTVVHSITMRGLGDIWLPLRWRPTRVVADDGISFDPESGSLIVDSGTVSEGFSYVSVSRSPTFGIETVGGTDEQPPDSFRDLPADSRARLAPLAEQLTAGSGSALESARAIQNYLRDGFTYDAAVDFSAEADPVGRFLSVRRGFCQQFAGTFAALARAAGLPSRVAVGFTYGDFAPGDSTSGAAEGTGTWTVRGRHAHAWPEVWLPNRGWVPFEPTPGRGNPASETLTGVPRQQSGGGEGPEPTDPPVSSPPPPTSPPAPGTLPPPGSNAEPPVARSSPDAGDQGSRALWWLLAGPLALAVIVGGRIAQLRGRRSARRGEDEAAVAWARWGEAAGYSGLAPRDGDTVSQWIRAVDRSVPLTDPVALQTAVHLLLYADPGSAGAPQVALPRSRPPAHPTLTDLCRDDIAAMQRTWSPAVRIRYLLGFPPPRTPAPSEASEHHDEEDTGAETPEPAWTR